MFSNDFKMIKKYIYPTSTELRQRQIEYREIIRKKLEPTEALLPMKLDELSTKITGSVQVAVKRICNQSKPKGSKLRANTLAILEKRRKWSKEMEKYKDLNKAIRKEIRKDLRNYNTQLVRKAIYENANMRVLQSKMTWGKTQIAKMKNGQEEITTKKKQI